MVTESRSGLSYEDKLRIANHDALKTLVALAVLVIVWAVCGFGLAQVDIEVFHVPLWVVAGLGCTWLCAIAAAVVLSRSFADFDLEKHADTSRPGDYGDAPLACDPCEPAECPHG